ncbi:MAG TPA: sugar-transfer associated ATP-grasp domain-containing protein, partial [Bacteroidales bacterium]|nr:sugar-transfer associated ATP-grasp domain-containing protein [Bacteroidales bacterium]
GCSSGGSNIYKLNYDEFNNGSTLTEKIYNEVISSEYLFQKTVSQHSEMDKLSSSSLNTIRIDTFIDKDGQVDVMSSYIRMSIADIHVDNISHGGCYVGIDIDTGRLKAKGYSTIDILGVKVLTNHPRTGIVFEGFTIPKFDEVKDLVRRAASYMPGLRMIGWDVAVTEDGPVLIEGNYDYEIRGNDFVAGGYLKNSVFRKALKEIDYV